MYRILKAFSLLLEAKGSSKGQDDCVAFGNYLMHSIVWRKSTEQLLNISDICLTLLDPNKIILESKKTKRDLFHSNENRWKNLWPEN